MLCVLRPCHECKNLTFTKLKKKMPKTTICSDCADKAKRSKP